MSIKKQSIFRKIVISLTIIIIFEAVLFSMSIWISGIESTLIQNAVDVLEQNIEKRELELNQLLTEQKKSLSNSSDYLDFVVAQKVKDDSVNDYLKEGNNAENFLKEVAPELLMNMRNCSYSGIFVVLSNGEENVIDGQSKSFKGVYFRDTDNKTSVDSYSDILAERGSEKVFSSQNIAMDSVWQKDFIYYPDVEDSMHYYFKPYEALMASPEDSEQDLGYWSSPFYLSDENLDTYKIITYSMPLILENGEFYGVIGIEIPVTAISEILEDRTNIRENVGYALVSYDKRMSEEPMCEIKTISGVKLERFFEENDYIKLLDSALFDKIYKVKDKEFDNKQAYVLPINTQLYNANTYFSNEQWAILGITDSDTFFGLVENLRIHIMLALLISVAIGIMFMYGVTKRATMPIRELSDLVQNTEFDKPIEVEGTGIEEIDELYRVLNTSAKKRIDMERQVKEERERFLIALQSSSDIIFEYDLMGDVFYSYNFKNTNEEGYISTQVTENFSNMKNLFVHPEDALIVHNVISDLKNDKVTFECRIRRKTTDENYEWFRINRKVVIDEENHLLKMIGNFKDIDEEKKISLAREEAEKRDYLTNLYKAQTWKTLVQRSLYLGKGEKSSLVLMDVDNFTNVNRVYGMLHCDMILSNIGEIIRKYVGSDDLVARIGGDEFAIFVPGENKYYAAEIAKEISRDIEDMYIGEDKGIKLSCSVGIVEDELSNKIEELLEYAKEVLCYVKTTGKGRVEFYTDEINAKDKILCQMYINPIVSKNLGENDTLATFAFNVFEHANDINSSINLFLSRIGAVFGISRILIEECDKEYSTMIVKNQWAIDKKKLLTNKKKIIHYEKVYLEKILEDYEKEPLQIIKKEDSVSIYNAVFDNGEFYGDIVLIDENPNRIWTDEEIQEVKEIIKIVSAYVIKSKYDAVSRAKSEFLSRMSHEIRTPMNAIIGMTHMAIQEQENSKKLLDCLKKIDSSTKYLLSIINDILDMSRIESGKMKIAYVTADIEKFLQDLSVVVKSTADNKNIEFIVENNLKSNKFYMDTLRVNQVLINLLGNAVKFTPENGKIRLTINEIDDVDDRVNVRFDVIDTGIGISEENQVKIFNSFEQAEDSTALNYGGTGLGLSISSNLVKMMGGNLKVSSKLGEGSDFYFVLNLQKSNEELESQEEIEFDQGMFKGNKILLVEDNEINIEIAEELLRDVGFEVEKAMNGQEAVEKFENAGINEYSAILMDVRMPIMNGLEATGIIRKLNRKDATSIPIIAMSANAFDEDVKKSIDSGMNGHLAKPVDILQLYRELKKYILDRNM